jgi:hypothetical protein
MGGCGRPFNGIVSQLPVRPTSKTRKPVDELTAEDLATYPMWEYALDEEGAFAETVVRPLELQTVPRDSYCIQVAARFQLRSGAEYPGCAEVTTATDPPTVSPSFILVGGGAVALPAPRSATPDVDLGIDLTRINLPRQLKVPIVDIFPAKYQLLVNFDGEDEPRGGTLT